ncbi:MAG TPA: hypothetical protein VL495_04025 [Edaphobacter sp.]|nr:hypothetical protein [Edaphobacter sp.]
MRLRSFVVLIVLVLTGALVWAKDKDKSKKDVLPPYVLSARTVLVMIDPNSGVSFEDPTANQIARRDVEAAFQSWGRFEPALVGQPADLIIIIRRGHQRMVDATMPDPRQNSRVGGISATDDGAIVGARQGPPPTNDDPTQPRPTPVQSNPQLEVSSPDDYFAVYQGRVPKPLDAPPAWRYIAHDGLHPHNVPAVGEFRKAVVAAEKAANQP